MKSCARSSRIVALAAAYVVALQALLLPLSVAAGNPIVSSLCATTADSSQPASHENGCPCAAGCGMQCHGEGLAGPPQAIVTLALSNSPAAIFAPAFEPVVQPAVRGPQIPRAPPAV